MTRINGIFWEYWYDGQCYGSFEAAMEALMEDHPEYLDDDLPDAGDVLISEQMVEHN